MYEYSKRWHKKKYNELKQLGLCPRCGKEKPQQGKIYCKKCVDKIVKYKKKKMFSNNKDKGV